MVVEIEDMRGPFKKAKLTKHIDKKQFEELCKLQCTMAEFCGVLDVDEKTLTKWCKLTYNMPFSQVFRLKRTLGTASLRRSQFKMAERSSTMSIWLGKQYLGQKEIPDEEPDGEEQKEFMSILRRSAKAVWDKKQEAPAPEAVESGEAEDGTDS